ncbi:MAG: HPF/RaiA family ribosome-associated protein [Planctomycetia bacterium]|nr:HPF/RaiA family ribosome-associated protein [Planctomycetia bacterium]
MQTTVQVSFRNLAHDPALESDIRRRAAKLEEFCGNMVSCHVVLEVPHHHHQAGNLYRVRMYISVPRRDIEVDHAPAEHEAYKDLKVVVRDAFKEARRKLQDYVREVQGHKKAHQAPAHGRIHELFPDDDYGFIETADGREIYFHANSLLDVPLAKLKLGMDVRYVEELGDKGPQATSVRLVGRHHHIPG